jgi:protein phosphatase
MTGIREHAATTHTGQVRRSNEDSYLSAPPLFVVADGMGGARAGEVASRICVDTFRDMAGAVGLPDELLERVISEANHRIHIKAQSDPALGGMGTTVTAALLTDRTVTIGHVGDSRAYRLRDGVLEQLTEDHSLVGELLRAGAITEREAATHPQRAIITRVLGTEARVIVDTLTVPADEGDVFMLCSDGLTAMVAADQIAGIVGSAASLSDACRALVQAANRAGGDDNITIILFRVGEPPDVAVSAPPAMVATSSAPPPPLGIRDLDDEPRRRSIGRRILTTTAVLVIVVAAAVGAATFMRWSHFVGAGADGRVAVFQGVPVDLAGGLKLYRQVRTSAVPVAVLSQAERTALFDHKLGSSSDSWRRIERLPAYTYFSGAAGS